MQNCFHQLRGRYNIKDQWVGLDFSILDPLMSEATWAHEISHSVISQQGDFGQATASIFKLSESMNKLGKNELTRINLLLYNSQKNVQECFATLMQIVYIKSKIGKNKALRWAEENLHGDYLKLFRKTAFIFNHSQRYIDFFTQKIPFLAMETGIRAELHKIDGLSSSKIFEKYLSNDNHNPDKRFEQILKLIEGKTWMITKPVEEIAQACGIKHFPPSTKSQVSDFINYVLSFTSINQKIRPEDIGDTPQGQEAFIAASENMIVGNMNLNLAETAEVIFNLDDFLFYGDRFDTIFINPIKNWDYQDLTIFLFKKNVDYGIIGFCRTGEKYILAASQEELEKACDRIKCTMIVKWGAFDLINDHINWTVRIRTPDIVWYNNSNDMVKSFEPYVKKFSPTVKYIHMGLAENHMVQTLFIKFNKSSTIHAVSTFGNKKIHEIKQLFKDACVISSDELVASNEHINNLLAIWGFSWKVDWVRTMLDGNKIIIRK